MIPYIAEIFTGLVIGTVIGIFIVTTFCNPLTGDIESPFRERQSNREVKE